MWLNLPIPSLKSQPEPECSESQLQPHSKPSEFEPLLSAVVSGKVVQRPRSWRQWSTRQAAAALFGTMREPSSDGVIGDWNRWMSSVRDTHANPSLTLADVMAVGMNATFGPQCVESLRELSHNSSSLKTSKGTSALGLGKSFGISKDSATKLRSDCTRRRKLARHTAGNESSSLELFTTPQAHDVTERGSGQQPTSKAGNACLARDGKNGATPNTATRRAFDKNPERGGGQSDLMNDVSLWATPRASANENRNTTMPPSHGITRGETSSGQAVNWSTPNANPEAPNMSTTRENGETRARITEQGMGAIAKTWATPAARDYRAPNELSYQERGGGAKGEQLSNQVVHSFPQDEPTTDNGLDSLLTVWARPTCPRLSPAFQWWLMGWPHPQIYFGSAETESCRCKQLGHSCHCSPACQNRSEWHQQRQSVQANLICLINRMTKIPTAETLTPTTTRKDEMVKAANPQNSQSSPLKVYESTDLAELDGVGVAVGEPVESEPVETENRLHKDPPSKTQDAAQPQGETPTLAANPSLGQIAFDDGKIRVSRKEYSRIVGLVQELFEAEQRCEKIEAIANYLAEQSKEAKESLKNCEERKADLLSELRKVNRGDAISELTDSLLVDEPAMVEGGSDDDNSAESSIAGHRTGNTPNTDTAWRAVPTSVLFEPPIKGCGAKKVEAIMDQCPTLGHFEDLRCKASPGDPLHSLLPKGVGLDLASELEERHLTAVTKDWSTKTEAAGDGGDEVEAETEAIETADGKNDGQGVDSSPDDEDQQIRDRCDELADTLAVGGKLDRSNENQMAGYQSAEDGLPVTACGWTAGTEQDEWLTGWILYEEDESGVFEDEESQLASAIDDL